MFDKVFDYYGSAQGRQKLVSLGTAGERRGLLRLAHDFDVCPAMLTKREVKQLFSAVCRCVQV